MEVVSFHIRSKMAHFRKFYSNSSALTYFVPPRITIRGVIELKISRFGVSEPLIWRGLYGSL